MQICVNLHILLNVLQTQQLSLSRNNEAQHLKVLTFLAHHRDGGCMVLRYFLTELTNHRLEISSNGLCGRFQMAFVVLLHFRGEPATVRTSSGSGAARMRLKRLWSPLKQTC